MMHGMIDALKSALAQPTADLQEALRGITAEQRRTNELLEQLVANTTPAKRTVRSAEKLNLNGDGK